MTAAEIYDHLSAREIRDHLTLLAFERLEAESRGLTDCAHYKRDLEEEIGECRAAFVRAAVTEIAVLDAELRGRRLG